MSLNVPMVQGRLRGSCGTLGRALGWIHSSHLYYSALQTLAPHLTALRRALGAVSSEGQEARDTQARIPPHGSPTAIDKEPACAAWALWCSPSCPGTSETHLQPPEPLREWPSERGPLGSRNHDDKRLHGVQLTLQLSTWCLFVKSSYWMWILFGKGFWLWSCLVSQLSSGPHQTLFHHRWPRESSIRCLQWKTTWFC